MRSRFASFFLIISGLYAGVLPVQAFPPTIDSDVQVQASQTGSIGGLNYLPYLVQGWLHLTKSPNSEVKYSGTFTDNLGGGKSYPAKADVTDPNAPVLQVTTRFGNFVFTMSSAFGTASYSASTVKSKPARFANSGNISFSAVNHSYITTNYNLQLEFAVGVLGGKVGASGITVSLIKDQMDFIVPRDPVTRAVSSLSLPTNPRPKFVPIAGPGYYHQHSTGSYVADGFFLSINYEGRNVMLCGKYANGVNAAQGFFGSAVISGARTAAGIGVFDMGVASE